MKSWRLTFPLRRCPKCGATIRATFTGYLRLRGERGTVGDRVVPDPADGEDG